VRIVYAEQFPAREDALRREQQIKRWRREKKEALVRDAASLPGMSRTHKDRPAFTWRDLLNARES
jgi:predicted GIY-YIG superfamily endonuclease